MSLVLITPWSVQISLIKSSTPCFPLPCITVLCIFKPLPRGPKHECIKTHSHTWNILLEVLTLINKVSKSLHKHNTNHLVNWTQLSQLFHTKILKLLLVLSSADDFVFIQKFCVFLTQDFCLLLITVDSGPLFSVVVHFCDDSVFLIHEVSMDFF